MNTDQATWDDAMRAVHHHAGVIWDANAALQDAYQIDTGDTTVGTWPRWSELTYATQVAFMVTATEVLQQTLRIQESIVDTWRRLGGGS